MSTDHYLREKCGPGTSAFYAVLFAPRAKREALRAVYVLWRELREVAEEHREPAVARTKIEWWRTEIERAAAGAPRHPVMRALAEPLAAGAFATSDLHATTTATEAALAAPAIASLADLDAYALRVASAFLQLAGRSLGLAPDDAATLATPLATAHELTRLITMLGADPQRNARLLPQDVLTRHTLEPGDWRGPHTSASLRAVLQHLAAEAQARYALASAALAAADRARARPLLIHAAIERARLAQVAADGFPVLREQTLLPPLRMLAIATRARFWPAQSAG